MAGVLVISFSLGFFGLALNKYNFHKVDDDQLGVLFFNVGLDVPAPDLHTEPCDSLKNIKRKVHTRNHTQPPPHTSYR